MGSPNDDLRSGRRDERARRHRDDDDDDEDEDEDDESSDGTTPRRGHRRFSDVARSPRDLTAARLEVIGQHRGCRRGNELKGGERTNAPHQPRSPIFKLRCVQCKRFSPIPRFQHLIAPPFN
jgi:hypothetical protein